ncbi:hypothetical protein Ptr902_08065 [Pyrenophora tritici-repentis]|nr:hypothetical protein Ptr902_08065 [Pyrenophora tritici-repentis]
MKYLATIISLALALAPAALADVACCLQPSVAGIPSSHCQKASDEATCCSAKLFKSCAGRGTFKWTYAEGNYAPPATNYPCTGGGAGRCVRKGTGIPP